MTSDMTSGNSMKQLVRFFVPVLVSNLFQQFYSLCDGVIVSRGIGAEAFAAVGATGTLDFMIIGFAIGLTSGFGIHFSHAFGAGNFPLLRQKVMTAGALAAGISVFMTALTLIIMRPFLVFLNTPESILPDSDAYFRVLVLGMIFTVFSNFFITLLETLGDGKTPLVAMIVSSAVNILLDLLAVMVLGMGVRGAALATVIAKICSIAVCLNAVRKIEVLRYGREEIRVTPEYLIPLVKTGLPVALMNSVTSGGCMVIQYFVNGMGAVCVAAYSASMKFQGIMEQFGQAVSLATFTFVGQNCGAGKFDRVRKGVRQSLLLSILVNIPIAMLEIFGWHFLAGIILTDEETIQLCGQFIFIMGCFRLVLGFLFVFRCATQALGNTFLPMLSGVLETVTRFTVSVIAASRSFRGAAYAEVGAWTAAAVMLCFTYIYTLRKKEKEQREEEKADRRTNQKIGQKTVS